VIDQKTILIDEHVVHVVPISELRYARVFGDPDTHRIMLEYKLVGEPPRFIAFPSPSLDLDYDVIETRARVIMLALFQGGKRFSRETVNHQWTWDHL